jgi:hypothetical protein
MIYQIESKPYKARPPRTKGYCYGCAFQNNYELCMNDNKPFCCKDGVHIYIFVRVAELSHNIKVV